jgi:hypothetical protein
VDCSCTVTTSESPAKIRSRGASPVEKLLRSFRPCVLRISIFGPLTLFPLGSESKIASFDPLGDMLISLNSVPDAES